MATEARNKSSPAKKHAVDSDSVLEMTSEDMRNALYERLHNKGLLDALKVLSPCLTSLYHKSEKG